MFARIGKVMVIALLVVSTGLHWAALQTVAWTSMLAANLGNESLSQAVSQTFDGQHPCPLCRAIAAGKKSQQQNESTPLKLKLEYPPLAPDFALIAPAQFNWQPQSDTFASSLPQQPPAPPPRVTSV